MGWEGIIESPGKVRLTRVSPIQQIEKILEYVRGGMQSSTKKVTSLAHIKIKINSKWKNQKHERHMHLYCIALMYYSFTHTKKIKIVIQN